MSTGATHESAARPLFPKPSTATSKSPARVGPVTGPVALHPSPGHHGSQLSGRTPDSCRLALIKALPCLARSPRAAPGGTERNCVSRTTPTIATKTGPTNANGQRCGPSGIDPTCGRRCAQIAHPILSLKASGPAGMHLAFLRHNDTCPRSHRRIQDIIHNAASALRGRVHLQTNASPFTQRPSLLGPGPTCIRMVRGRPALVTKHTSACASSTM